MKVKGLICDKITQLFLQITIFFRSLEWSLKKQKEKKVHFCWFNFVRMTRRRSDSHLSVLGTKPLASILGPIKSLD